MSSILYFYSALNDHKNWHSIAARIEVRQVARPTAGAHPLSPHQLTDGGHVCPPGARVHPFSRAAPSPNSRRRRSRGVPVLTGQYSQGVGIDAQTGVVGFAFSLQQGFGNRFAVDGRDRLAAQPVASAGGAQSRRSGADTLSASNTW